MAEEAKAKGNVAMQQHNYEEAIEHYTTAINIDPNNYLYYSNRSAAYASIEKYNEALKDGEKTVELNPSWGKGYSRTGLALFKLGDLAAAKKAYETGLEKEPNNQLLAQALQEIEMAEIERSRPKGGDLRNIINPNVIDLALRTDPELRIFSQQPDFMAIVNEVKRNPNALTQHSSDPRVMKLFQIILQSAFDMSNLGGDNMQEEPKASEPKPAPKQEAPKPQEQPKPAPEPEPMNEEEINKNLAVEQKNLGNDFYKKKNFEQAILHYNKAIELNPNEMTFLTNRAAAYFESKNYEQCIHDCEEAIQVGRSHYASFELIAKAFARIGASYHKMGQLDKAIEAYRTSLTENRVRDVQLTLKKIETEKEEADKKAYLSPEIAQQEKEKGNIFFKENKFPEAIAAYSEAIKRDPGCAALYSNRAAAYMKLAEFHLAAQDCEKCIELDPTFIKAYKRKAQIYLFRKEFHKATDTYKVALKIAPEDAELQTGLLQVQQAIQNFNATATKEEKEARHKRSLEDPEIRGILQDPEMTQVLQTLSGKGDRKAAGEIMKNPEIQEKLEKLIAAGVVGF